MCFPLSPKKAKLFAGGQQQPSCSPASTCAPWRFFAARPLLPSCDTETGLRAGLCAFLRAALRNAWHFVWRKQLGSAWQLEVSYQATLCWWSGLVSGVVLVEDK